MKNETIENRTLVIVAMIALLILMLMTTISSNVLAVKSKIKWAKQGVEKRMMTIRNVTFNVMPAQK